MASKAIHPIIQRLIDLIEPTEDGRQAGPTSAFGHARNKGTNPHGGFDINRGKDVPGSVASPVYGKIGTVVRGSLGTIVIHEVDPVTKQPTGYDIEILHTQAQNVKPGDPVKPGQSIVCRVESALTVWENHPALRMRTFKCTKAATRHR